MRRSMQLKTWRVTMHHVDGSTNRCEVEAVNRRFALWNAEGHFGAFYWLRSDVDKVTTGRVQKRSCR